MKFRFTASFFLLFTLAFPLQASSPPLLDHLLQEFQARTDRAPAAGEIESAFSPEGNAERLVLKVINSASRDLRLAAYSFTSPTIVNALIRARRRGVTVRVVVDDSALKSKPATAALNLLAGAGIPARTNHEYAIHHDKYLIVDGRHVQTGSFNYSRAAAKSNSENVLVVWHNPALAASYLRHWESRYREGMDFKKTY